MAIELSKRATGVLSGILKGRKLTPHAVARFSEEKVLLQAGCGRTTFVEIEQWLLEHDLRLRLSRELVIPHKSRKARELLWLAGRHRDLLELMAWKARQRRNRKIAERTILARVLTVLDRSIVAPDRIHAGAKEDHRVLGSKAVWTARQVRKLRRMYDKMSKENRALHRRLERRQKTTAKTYMRTRPAKMSSARASA